MTIRGFAMGIAVFVLWTVNASISFVFPTLVAALGATVTFGLFALINIGSIFFVKKFAPETRGRTLEELEDDFRDARRRAPGAQRTGERARLLTDRVVQFVGPALPVPSGPTGAAGSGPCDRAGRRVVPNQPRAATAVGRQPDHRDPLDLPDRRAATRSPRWPG